MVSRYRKIIADLSHFCVILAVGLDIFLTHFSATLLDNRMDNHDGEQAMPKTTILNTSSLLNTIEETSHPQQIFLNVLYLLLSFFTGTFYFVFLVTTISVGVGTLVVWI